MWSWVLFGSWHRGHLCESVASGDIFDFWHPILSHLCLLFDVLIHFRGLSDRNPDLSPFQSILFHVTSFESFLSWRYLCFLLPCIFKWIWWRSWDETFTSSTETPTSIESIKNPSMVWHPHHPLMFGTFLPVHQHHNLFYPRCQGCCTVSYHLGVLSPIGGNAVKLNPSSFWWSLSQYPHCCCISIGVNICVDTCL